MYYNTNKRKFLIYFILCVSLLSIQAYADNWVDGTPYLYEEAQYLARSLGSGDLVSRAPSPGARPAVYNLGDEHNFYAINMLRSSQYMLKASLYAVSDRAYIFVEDGRKVAPDKIESLLTSFDKVYDAVTEEFGSPPDSIDSDPRIYILIMDIVDGAKANGARMVGYFSPLDQFRNVQLARLTNKRSNEIEILYVDYVSLDSLEGGPESVLAHEFMHMIQWARDPFESVWVNEGIAVYVEGMLGYEVKSRVSAFEKEYDASLLNWSGSLADYGAAYLFFAYLVEKYGGVSAIKEIVENRADGIEGIERALSNLGKSVSFDKIFSDWVIANYLDNPDIYDGIYGYSTLDVHLNPSAVEIQYPIISKKSQVKPWTAQYIEFKKEQNNALDLAIHEDNANDIVAQVIVISGEVNVSRIKAANERSGTAIISQGDSKIILVVFSQLEPQRLKKISDYVYSADAHLVIPDTQISVSPAQRKITTWGSVKKKEFPF